MISGYLKPFDWKTCRFVSRELNNRVTSALFKTVRFSFSEKRIQIFENISDCKLLASSVQTIVLSRSLDIVYQAFPSFQSWEERLKFADASNVHTTITSDEWLNMSQSRREALYKEYEKERTALRYHKDDFLRKTARCLQKMNNLSTFRFDSQNYDEIDWSERWKFLCFEELDDYTFAEGIEHDIDALHLALFMQALGSLNSPPGRLVSMSFELYGPGFLTPPRLQHIWDEFGHGKIRTLRKKHRSAVIADEEADKDLKNDSAKEYYSTQLNNLQSVIKPLEFIDLSVVESYLDRGLDTIAKPLTNLLCQGKNLTEIVLTFGNFHPYFATQPESYQQLLAYRKNRQDLLEQLTIERPWSALATIQISIATDSASLLDFLGSIASSLRYLMLDSVTLLPGDGERGKWEYVLPRIGKRLSKLNRLILADLRDFPTARGARKVFDSFEWKCCHCYEDFHTNVTKDILLGFELRYSLEKAYRRCRHVFVE